ncbi:MAG: hypothetical protein LBC82_00955 [Oscillospiraceae bacterium]|jgi:hypothetical protein|nr:hypothetical protein [Oscillospiraceae bacterium]
MKNILRKRLIIPLTVAIIAAISLFIFSIMVAGANSYVNSILGAKDAYDFPYSGEKTPELWGELKTQAERAALCNIPEDVLRNMSTAGLIETCMNYPFFFNFMFFNSPQQGFESIYQAFNGLKELYSRDDVADIILNLNTSLNLQKLITNEKSHALKFNFIQMLSSQDEILNKMTEKQRSELFQISTNRIVEISEKHSDVFSVNFVLLLMGRILIIDNPEFAKIVDEHEQIKSFFETGLLMISEDEYDSFVEKTEDIIRFSIIGR